MIGPTEHFQDLIDVNDPDHNGRTLALRSKLNIPSDEIIAALASAEMKRHGLVHCPGEMAAPSLIFAGEGGKRLVVEHHRLYSRVDPAEVLDAVAAHVNAIAANGPGRVWFLAPPVHLITDEANAVSMVGDHVLLRTFYGHEKQGVER